MIVVHSLDCTCQLRQPIYWSMGYLGRERASQIPQRARGRALAQPGPVLLPFLPPPQRGRGWMKMMMGRKGQPPAPSKPVEGIAQPNSSAGMRQHWQIRIPSPTICLDPRFHFSLLGRLGLAANIRCRHRFGMSPSPFPLPQTPRFWFKLICKC